MTEAIRLGLNLGNAGVGLGGDAVALARAAEECGYAMVWVAEAYGSDAPTVLSWIGAQTSTIGLGSAVMQIPGRSPAMTAMTAATLDMLSGGRMLLGLGVSGPQVSEGWHGLPFRSPLARTREYVGIVRTALARETVTSPGPHYPLPLPGGPGKALRLTVRPVQPRIPIYLAAVGPRNLELVGELADGWHGILVSPSNAPDSLDHLRAGRLRAGFGGDGSDPLTGFDTVASVQAAITDDLDSARARVAAYVALYIGGMGSREQNFYNDLAHRMGFGEAATRIQDLYLEGRARDAAAAVPVELVDEVSLIGPAERVAAGLRRFAEAGITTVAIQPIGLRPDERARTVRTMASLVDSL